MSDSDTLEASEWYRPGGGMMVRRIYLDESHPQSWPSLWFDKFGEPMPNYAREQIGLPPSKACCHCPHHCPNPTTDSVNGPDDALW